MIQFELVDPSFGEHKSTLFHTFCHDQNQIVGHEKFINLSQLKEQQVLRINIYMKEYLIHSCLSHYMSTQFGDYFSKDQKKIQAATIKHEA